MTPEQQSMTGLTVLPKKTFDELSTRRSRRYIPPVLKAPLRPPSPFPVPVSLPEAFPGSPRRARVLSTGE